MKDIVAKARELFPELDDNQLGALIQDRTAHMFADKETLIEQLIELKNTVWAGCVVCETCNKPARDGSKHCRKCQALDDLVGSG